LADEEVRKRTETLIGIGQRIVNQKDPSLKIKEAISLEMIKENKDASDVTKRAISREIVWQKISICTMRRKQMKTSI